MKKYLLKNKFVLPYFVLLTADAVNVSLMAVLLKQTLDAAISGEMGELKRTTVRIILFLFEYSLVSWGTRTLKAYYISDVMSALKRDLMSAILRKPVLHFSDKNRAEYISVFNNDLKLIEEKYINSVILCFRSGVILLVSLAIMIRIEPLVSLAAIVLSFLPGLIPKLYGRKLAVSTEGFSEQLKKYNQFIGDVFSGFEVVKNYSMENTIQERHADKNGRVEDGRKEMGRRKAEADVFTNFIAVGMQFSVFVISGFFVIAGKITAGDVLAITQLMNKVVNPVFDIVDGRNDMLSTKIIEQNMQKIIREGSAEGGSRREIPDVRKIELSGVSFSYSQGNEVLSGISLTLEKGKKYAVVGESGGGKSTLVKLMLGYYSGYNGKIFYDDRDRADYTQEDIFRYFSLVSQSVYLFEASVGDNISLWQDIPREEMDAVIRQVHLDETLRKKGCDTDYLLTGNGGNVSGGERQKIAMARAILRKKEWMFFDEATAGMDNEIMMQTEQMLLDLDGVTCVAITHRYKEEILSRYDKIFVVKRGKIIEEGTYEELIRGRGEFFRLFHTSEAEKRGGMSELNDSGI